MGQVQTAGGGVPVHRIGEILGGDLHIGTLLFDIQGNVVHFLSGDVGDFLAHPDDLLVCRIEENTLEDQAYGKADPEADSPDE